MAGELNIIHWAGQNVGSAEKRRNTADPLDAFHFHKMMDIAKYMTFSQSNGFVGENQRFADLIIIGEGKRTFFNANCSVAHVVEGINEQSRARYVCDFISLRGEGRKEEFLCVAYNKGAVYAPSSSVTDRGNGDRGFARIAVRTRKFPGRVFHIDVCHIENNPIRRAGIKESSFLARRLHERFSYPPPDLLVGDTNIPWLKFTSDPFVRELQFANRDEFPSTTIFRGKFSKTPPVDRAFVSKGRENRARGRYFRLEDFSEHEEKFSNHVCLCIQLDR